MFPIYSEFSAIIFFQKAYFGIYIGKIIINNIKTIPAFGHTKGHTAFLVSSKDKSVLIWGDMLHAVVQFNNFNIYMVYDDNPQTNELNLSFYDSFYEFFFFFSSTSNNTLKIMVDHCNIIQRLFF